MNANRGSYGAISLSGVYINGYGCVHCQKVHFEDQDIYAKHIYWQSKHGFETMTLERRWELMEFDQPDNQ
jgi:hypothetical protein